MDKETNDNEYRRQSEHRTSAPKRKRRRKLEITYHSSDCCNFTYRISCIYCT